jgi:hypothetical protein
MSMLLDVAQMCDRLGVSRSTWDKWRARGETPRLAKLPNGGLRTNEGDLPARLISAHPQKICVSSLSDRRKSRPTANPWVVRWSVDGRLKARSFPSKAMAERFRADLIIAAHAGERFDPNCRR